MACNTNRTDCTAESIFAAVANPNCGQFFNPLNFQAEQFIYDSAFSDLINNFGVPINYYVHTFNISAADTLYGEHPTSVFYGPVSVMMYIELTENAINLSKFGFASDDELTGYVHIKTFEQSLSNGNFYIQKDNGDFIQYSNLLTGQFSSEQNKVVEPKSGDLIEVTPLGCDRPGGRGAKIFEVTERTDQDIAQINPLLGHYVYRLKAKRFEYSFEPKAPVENESRQVYENTFAGKLSTNIPTVSASEVKSYPGDADTESKNRVLDMSINNIDIYGDYY